VWKKGKFPARNNSKTLDFLYNWDRATIQEGVVPDEVYTHGKTVCTVFVVENSNLLVSAQVSTHSEKCYTV